MIAVFDIDGVLADATHRQHHLAARPKDWDAFFGEVGADPVIEAGVRRYLEEATRHEVVLMSGRPERTRRDTREWLTRNGLGEPRMILREDADFRPAAVVKSELKAAGFVLEAESAVLRNPADPRTATSNNPPVPTDKFALRFMKPR